MGFPSWEPRIRINVSSFTATTYVASSGHAYLIFNLHMQISKKICIYIILHIYQQICRQILHTNPSLPILHLQRLHLTLLSLEPTPMYSAIMPIILYPESAVRACSGCWG